jgi:hypothetical protein
MKFIKKLGIALIMFCGMILLDSCSTSQLSDVWNNRLYHGTPLKKILIVSMRKDSSQRRIWEDAFVGKFASIGIQALPSYHSFPDALPDTNQIMKCVDENGFDGIVVVSPLDSKTNSYYVPGTNTYEIQSQYNAFRKKYDIYYYTVQHPGYVESEVINCRAIEVWNVRDKEELIWGAVSNSPELNSSNTVSADVAELVIKNLMRHDIISAKK